MPYDFEVSALVAASPEAIYRAWMSSDEHSAMTGGEAHVNPVVGGEFTAWDQYIKGTTLELDPFGRIVQSWRTKHFTDGDPDSQIEVLLEPRGDQSLVRFVHTNVPDEDRGYEEGGWKDNYLDPMREYFATRN